MLLQYDTFYSMELALTVRQYYLDHFDDLPFDKQFHFAGRLSAWNRDDECRRLLNAMRPLLLPHGQEGLQETLRDLNDNPPQAKINAAAQRAPYFEKYPLLRGRMLALFRVRHMRDIYAIDSRSVMTELVSEADLQELAHQLILDENALRVLSTYAINYIYLVRHILFPDISDPIDPKIFHEAGKSLDPSDPTEALLLIYLYTHCIIGESNFYNQSIATNRLPAYQSMLADLERVINEHFDSINLDNKLEYLVCERICGQQSNLAERIYEECSQSISPEGTFLIDTINHAPQSQKTSFAESEHRNVLFIMSTLDYVHA